ncbi:MAG TPA: acyl-CoA dehydrogenase family protein, partial [Acidimicrobiales bacterium]|nr:acyl-CoA dehydrogenase family protein [Acidimicrobiales bacterium]
MAVETTLPEEVETLEEHARSIARDVLGPGADRAERSGAWDEASVRAFDQLDVRSLWLPDDCGGAGDPLAAVVALEALATGGAGGLPLADQPGPASGALWVMPDRDRAREMARSSLGTGAVCAAGVADALRDVGPGFAVSWAPGGGAPAALVVAARDGVALVDGADLRAEPVDAMALWASGGVRLHVADGATPEAFPLDGPAALVARAVPRLWSGAVLCG